MAAQQQAIWTHFVASLKNPAEGGKKDDSDSSLDKSSNRGNKLKRKARHTRIGQLAPANGSRSFRQTIEHAGYRRDIISRRMRLLNDEGYHLDSEEEFADEEDNERLQIAAVAAAELDPYANIKIEHLLAPLTSFADLPHHPTLSRPFTSNILSELTRHGGAMVQKEKASLWKIKHLLTKLSGDENWAPCGLFEADDDFDYFKDNRLPQSNTKVTKRRDAVLGHKSKPMGSMLDGNPLEISLSDHGSDQNPNGINVQDDHATEDDVHEGAPGSSNIIPTRSDNRQAGASTQQSHAVTGEALVPNLSTAMDAGDPLKRSLESGEKESNNDISMDDHLQALAPRRMRMRAQVQASEDNTIIGRSRSATVESEETSQVHPYFLAPSAIRADRDMGLPAYEAEETRRILQLYIQKQEEICRRAQLVYNGLLRADRYRKLVFKWARAEAHVGSNRDMSDGEDWYDREEWGLSEDLKKGQEDEEDDAATNAKKTRNRR